MDVTHLSGGAGGSGWERNQPAHKIQFLDKLLREDLERAVDALPEPFRVVLVLADMQGCAYQEIAETLNIPIAGLMSRRLTPRRCPSPPGPAGRSPA